MSDKIILLVEDDPKDEALTLRALKKSKILNEVVVARDGVEALDYLFGRGAHAGRDVAEIQWIAGVLRQCLGVPAKEAPADPSNGS